MNRNKLSKAKTGKLWSGLRKSWKGFKIAKSKGNKTKMQKYAAIINKNQAELGLKKTRFRK